MRSIDQLLKVASNTIGPEAEFRGQTGLLRALLDLLERRNGFYAFEGALLVRPGSAMQSGVHDVRAWNEKELWKCSYEFDLPEVLFFSENIFGDQFGILNETIVSFEAETGEVSEFAQDLDAWAGRLLSESDYWTGHPLAHQWQKINGPLPIGCRLMTKQPFVLGGDFAVENLVAYEEAKGMKVRGFLATQIQDVPDGGKIEFELTD